jgi:hypothetical protein
MQRKLGSILVALGLLSVCAPALAQHEIGVPPDGQFITQDVAVGWSAKRTLLGRAVYNQNNEKIGSIDDLIIGADGTVTHVIISAGSFVREKKHDVAVDTASLDARDGKLYVDGATREVVKALPKFAYSASL